MKQNLLVLAVLIFGLLFFFSQGEATCPQDPNDNGNCDSLYVEAYYPDQAVYWPSPFFVRFPIYVTHDVPDPYVDSLTVFVTPLCFTHTNPGSYCSVSTYWNNTSLYPSPDINRSVFRHYIQGQDTLIHNWMMDLSQRQLGLEWDLMVLNLDGTSHFWFATLSGNSNDQWFGEGSRVLLATMTFKLQDTMTICVDTCLWPPANHVNFCRTDAECYVPRPLMPVCERVGVPFTTIQCPPDDQRHTNGTFQSGKFIADTDIGYVTVVDMLFSPPPPPGITNLNIIYTIPPPARHVEGYVSYTVSDHCLGGGNIQLEVYNNIINGPVDFCNFNVYLSDSSPVLNVPDHVLVFADYTTQFQILSVDPDSDSVGIVMDAFWYEPDTIQIPTNPPSYDGGNPGLFSWLPQVSDTGNWIASFSATDICGKADTQRVNIPVIILLCGDCSHDVIIELSDVVYLITYLYKSGPAPVPLCQGDANCDGVVEIGDVVRLITYLYKSGSPPCLECCPH